MIYPPITLLCPVKINRQSTILQLFQMQTSKKVEKVLQFGSQNGKCLNELLSDKKWGRGEPGICLVATSEMLYSGKWLLRSVDAKLMIVVPCRERATLEKKTFNNVASSSFLDKKETIKAD